MSAGQRSRAAASIAPAKSSPTTRAPRARAMMAKSPVPQARSSTVSSPPTPSASISEHRQRWSKPSVMIRFMRS